MLAVGEIDELWRPREEADSAVPPDLAVAAAFTGLCRLSPTLKHVCRLRYL